MSSADDKSTSPQSDLPDAPPDSTSSNAAEPNPEPVPRVPRGFGLRLAMPELIRIGFFAALLVAVLATRQTCADSVATFMGTFDEPAVAPAPPPPPQGGIIDSLPDGMELKRLDDEEIRKAFPGIEDPAAAGANQDVPAATGTQPDAPPAN